MTSQPPLPQKNRTIWIITLLIILFLLALPKIFGPKRESAPKGKQPSAQKVSVNAHIVRLKPISETIKVPGSIIPNEQVELKSEAAGRITKLLLREGSDVAKGTLLIKINDADLQAQLEKAQASLTLASDRASRQNVLLEKSLVSKEDYDFSVKELNAAKADISLLNAQIAKTEIRAPYSGRIGLKFVSEGAFVAIGTKIADFISMKPLKVEFSVPERYAGKMVSGTPLSFTVGGSPTLHSAKVFASQGAIDEATRSLRIRAVCSGNLAGVVPGLFAEILVTLAEKPHAIVIPSECLAPDIKGQKVFCVKGGKAVPVPVITGVRSDQDVEIVKGLKEGDTVVTSGLLMLRPGVTITIKTIN